LEDLADVGINAGLILKWGLKKWDTRMWTRLILPRVGATEWSLVDKIMELPIAEKTGNFLTG
jgi:hypothetical protein